MSGCCPHDVPNPGAHQEVEVQIPIPGTDQKLSAIAMTVTNADLAHQQAMRDRYAATQRQKWGMRA